MILSNLFSVLLLGSTATLASPVAIVSEEPLPVTYSISIDKASGRRSLMYMHYKYKATYYGDAAPVLAALPKECTMDPVAKINRFFCPLSTSFNGKTSLSLVCNSQSCQESFSTISVPFKLVQTAQVQVDLSVDRYNTFRGDYTPMASVFGSSCAVIPDQQVPTISCQDPISLPNGSSSVNVVCTLDSQTNVPMKCFTQY